MPVRLALGEPAARRRERLARATRKGCRRRRARRPRRRAARRAGRGRGPAAAAAARSRRGPAARRRCRPSARPARAPMQPAPRFEQAPSTRPGSLGDGSSEIGGAPVEPDRVEELGVPAARARGRAARCRRPSRALVRSSPPRAAAEVVGERDEARRARGRRPARACASHASFAGQKRRVQEAAGARVHAPRGRAAVRATRPRPRCACRASRAAAVSGSPSRVEREEAVPEARDADGAARRRGRRPPSRTMPRRARPGRSTAVTRPAARSPRSARPRSSKRCARTEEEPTSSGEHGRHARASTLEGMAVVIASNLRKELAGYAALRRRLVQGRAPRPRGALRAERRRQDDAAARCSPARPSCTAASSRSRRGRGSRCTTSGRRSSADLTLREYVLSGARDLVALEEELRAARAGDGRAATHDEATLRRYAEAQARLEHAGGYDWRDRATPVAARARLRATTTSTGRCARSPAAS